MVHKKRPQWSLYFTLELYFIFLLLHMFNAILCQTYYEVPPRLYVLKTAPFIVPFSTELRGACWIGGLFSSLVLHFESLAPTLKDCC